MQYERYDFRKETLSVSPTIDSYYTKLKRLMQNTVNLWTLMVKYIPRLFRDVREKKLSKPNLSLQNLFLYARSLESLRRNSNMMSASTVTTPHSTPQPGHNPKGVLQDDNVTPYLAYNPEGGTAGR